MGRLEAPDLDRQVRLRIYDRFAEDGHPPTIDETARALGLPITDVEESYKRLAEGRVIVLRPGTTDIWMQGPDVADLAAPFDRGSPSFAHRPRPHR